MWSLTSPRALRVLSHWSRMRSSPNNAEMSRPLSNKGAGIEEIRLEFSTCGVRIADLGLVLFQFVNSGKFCRSTTLPGLQFKSVTARWEK